MRVIPVQGKQEACVTTSNRHLVASLAFGEDQSRLICAEERQAAAVKAKCGALLPVDKGRFWRPLGDESCNRHAASGNKNFLSGRNPAQQLAVLIAELTYGCRFHCATNL